MSGLPGGSRPATECTAVTSSDSCRPSRGRIAGSRSASMVFPAPGGPSRKRWWPPAAATSTAVRAES
ncbi:hypothetical protein ACH49_08425 [Streptomyces leeuwenhoekii]|uniref:Uncharacterized protein n=1 Tax=Streptomyces leeuwenhoekii TaxID=1437453 RepID=A0ABR5I1S5_STRLW|nr:hypothetical protein ACH49_08425 [Streptomyces leeuwenhoekii]